MAKKRHTAEEIIQHLRPVEIERVKGARFVLCVISLMFEARRGDTHAVEHHEQRITLQA